MRKLSLLAAPVIAASILAAPAGAGVVVVGSSPARLCYEAAESNRPASEASLANCNEALQAETATLYEIVATHVNRGILKMRMGETAEAISDFDKAIALDAEEPEAHLNKAVALLPSRDRAAEAISLFNTAIEARTRRPALAYFGRAIAHEELGNIRSAYLDYRRASLADPRWTEPRAELTRFNFRR